MVIRIEHGWIAVDAIETVNFGGRTHNASVPVDGDWVEVTTRSGLVTHVAFRKRWFESWLEAVGPLVE